MSCICQECKREYKMDLIINDEDWELIKPINKPRGSGLLCPECIIKKLEKLYNYCCYYLKSNE